MGVVPFVGNDFGKLKKEILSGQFHVPYLMSRGGQNL